MPSKQAFTSLVENLSKRLEGHPESTQADRVLALLEKLEGQAAALEKVRAARNPLDTDAAHARKVAKAAKMFQSSSNRIDQQINEILTLGFREIYEGIDAKAGLIQGEHASEIRAAFRSMTDSERSDALVAALGSDNGEVLAAVGLAPAMLSGLTQETQKHYIDVIRQQKAPELIQASEDLSAALSTAEAARNASGMMFDNSYNMVEQTAIDRAEAEAHEAGLALMESVVS